MKNRYFQKSFDEKKSKDTGLESSKNTKPQNFSKPTVQDRREDPRCPLNEARNSTNSYLFSHRGLTFGNITKNPGHPTCRLCTHRNEEICVKEKFAVRLDLAGKKEKMVKKIVG